MSTRQKKGGLVDARKMRDEIQHQIHMERAQEALERSIQECISKMTARFPIEDYTDKQREEICLFIIESRPQLLDLGYQTSSKFIDMFFEMMNMVLSKGEAHTKEQAFNIVMAASYRLVN